jgi:anti-sigma regulatory factor (Ser/Thr protein kinase)
MIRKCGGDGFPGQWQHAGARAFSPRRDQIDRVPVARPSGPPGTAGGHWLMLAAEMAGLASGNVWSSLDPGPVGRACPPRIATRALGADAGSVRAARNFTIATLHRWDTAERSQDIATVVSELLTNALRHALSGARATRSRRPIQLGLLQLGRCVLCAVADPGRTAPAPRAPGFLAETGRGLHIICALSDQWGCTTPGEAGKVVWATFYLRNPVLPLLSVMAGRVSVPWA